jgi:RNA polymerase sigma-70 factor (ECF subfamily)
MTGTENPGNHGHDLAELFRHHGDGLAGVVRGVLGSRADTQELLQEAFLRAFQALRRGFVPDDHVAWLFVITMNLARDQRRRDVRRATRCALEEHPTMEPSTNEVGPAQNAEQLEALQVARAAIHDLEDKEREVFLLRTSAGLTFEAAAAALGIPVGTAKTRMRAALIQLRARLRHIAPTGTGPRPEQTRGRQAR